MLSISVSATLYSKSESSEETIKTLEGNSKQNVYKIEQGKERKYSVFYPVPVLAKNTDLNTQNDKEPHNNNNGKNIVRKGNEMYFSYNFLNFYHKCFLTVNGNLIIILDASRHHSSFEYSGEHGKKKKSI